MRLRSGGYAPAFAERAACEDKRWSKYKWSTELVLKGCAYLLVSIRRWQPVRKLSRAEESLALVVGPVLDLRYIVFLILIINLISS